MHGTIRISEAAAMAIHAMTLIAAEPKRFQSVRRIAESLGVSEAHLAKVLQRLARAGLAKSVRGPGGGYALARPRGRITLLEIVEAIEGPLEEAACVMPTRSCTGGACVFGGLLGTVDRKVRTYLSATTLGRLSGVYG